MHTLLKGHSRRASGNLSPNSRSYFHHLSHGCQLGFGAIACLFLVHFYSVGIVCWIQSVTELSAEMDVDHQRSLLTQPCIPGSNPWIKKCKKHKHSYIIYDIYYIWKIENVQACHFHHHYIHFSTLVNCRTWYTWASKWIWAWRISNSFCRQLLIGSGAPNNICSISSPFTRNPQTYFKPSSMTYFSFYCFSDL